MNSPVNSREQVLRNIRSAIDVRNQSRADSGTASSASENPPMAPEVGTEPDLPSSVRKHLEARGKHRQPAFANNQDLTERLLQQMDLVQITVTRLQTTGDVPAAVDDYLEQNGIKGEFIVSPQLAGLEWPQGTLSGAARDGLQPGQSLTSVTPTLCAVAETGSLVTRSDTDTPSTLNFLPDNHIVVLHENQIVGHLEDAWELQRAAGDTPRALNFLTGPSRTADIEQTIELGAHGPRRMHVLLVAESR